MKQVLIIIDHNQTILSKIDIIIIILFSMANLSGLQAYKMLKNKNRRWEVYNGPKVAKFVKAILAI